MRKKFSKYYLSLMMMSGVSIILAVLIALEDYPELSAVTFMCSFICWFAGVKAPDHEKYSK